MSEAYSARHDRGGAGHRDLCGGGASGNRLTTCSPYCLSQSGHRPARWWRRLERLVVLADRRHRIRPRLRQRGGVRGRPIRQCPATRPRRRQHDRGGRAHGPGGVQLHDRRADQLLRPDDHLRRDRQEPGRVRRSPVARWQDLVRWRPLRPRQRGGQDEPCRVQHRDRSAADQLAPRGLLQGRRPGSVARRLDDLRRRPVQDPGRGIALLRRRGDLGRRYHAVGPGRQQRCVRPRSGARRLPGRARRSLPDPQRRVPERGRRGRPDHRDHERAVECQHRALELPAASLRSRTS